MSAVEGQSVLNALRSQGQLTEDQFDRAMAEARTRGSRAEEAILTTDGMSESMLMKWLAAHHRTQFVSTEKLSRANVDRQLLRMVPRQLAQRALACPILWKAGSGTLAVVVAEPNGALEDQLRAAAGAKTVKLLVARPAAIEAAIKKHYDGDARAFVPLLGERAVRKKKKSGVGAAYDTGAFPSAESGAIPIDGFDNLDSFDDFGFAGVAPTAPAPVRQATPPAKPPPGPPPPPPDNSPLVISAPDIVAGLAAGAAPSEPRSISSAPPEALAGERAAYLDMLHVMITLLERDRGELKDHSLEVARLTRDLCDRLGLRGSTRHGIVIAAYLHDIGKSGNYHLTALNVSRYEGHRSQAERSYGTPGRLFEGTAVPKSTLQALDHLYERWDGKGFPGRLKGTDIPLGARIIAIAETFADLTGHAKNPYRRALEPAEALNAMQGFAESLFDPSLVRLLRELAIGDLERKLLAERRTILLVDPDPDETTVLDIRLSAGGYDVRVARDGSDALDKVDQHTIDAIVSEVQLGGTDGFAMMEKLQAKGFQGPILFLTSKGDRESVNRGFALGAADYLVKPASPEVVVAKVRQLLSSGAGRGIRGSLSEMALPDVVQVLGNGRKSGKLVVRGNGKSGELYFREGHVWDASIGGERGEEAFYALMRIDDGEFSLDPTQLPSTRLIEVPTETLLLEAMRRVDEG
ncbi:MAG: DUF4388 domain-containing protein [Deltaproteobacteria bacterium]|nr:DUF4388 domain-containing protein [Deltaproteobacteria bacterium]